MSRTAGSTSSRLTRSASVTLGLLLAASTLGAQDATAPALTRMRATRAWELVFSSGALVPTGAQRDVIKRGSLSTAQLSYVVASRFAVTSTFGWARSRDLGLEGDPKLAVFTYDVGVEARAPRWRGGERISLTPFAGAGAGGRSFDHRGRDLDATHGVAGYASVGGELAAGRARVRLEARDYLTGMTPLAGAGRRVARNDVVLLAGLRFVRKRAATD